MEGIKVKTEPAEDEPFISEIDIEEHPVKLEPEDQLDFLQQNAPSAGGLTPYKIDLKPNLRELSRHRFNCEHCKTLNFSNKSQILKHIQTKHLKKRRNIKFTCKLCKIRFVKKENLKFHIKNVHENIIPINKSKNANGRTFYKCTMCRFENHFKYKVKDHYRLKHSKDRPFICETCSKGFCRSYDLKTHMIKHTKSNFECQLCEKKLKSLGSLQGHMHFVHTENNKRFQCDKCPSKFKSKSNLNAHKERMHSNIKYKCKLCNIPIKSAHYLRVHLKLKHTTEQNFECKMCQKKFSMLWVLNKHNRAQHPENRESKCVECDACGAVFIKKITLLRHIEDIHLYDRSNIINCQYCPRKLRSEMGLQMHLRRKHRNLGKL